MALASVAKFADDAAALEKTLRFVQGVCTTAIGLLEDSTEAVAPWLLARSQVNLCRRFFRLHKWYPCWMVAYTSLGDNRGALEKLMEVAKWSFLGAYFFLEMPTLTNVMGITTFSWGTRLQLEANKCWFYAISWSIALSIYRLLMLYVAASTTNRAMIIDGCDILIPGSVIGWISVNRVVVGLCMTTSSLVAGRQIWRRVQASVP